MVYMGSGKEQPWRRYLLGAVVVLIVNYLFDLSIKILSILNYWYNCQAQTVVTVIIMCGYAGVVALIVLWRQNSCLRQDMKHLMDLEKELRYYCDYDAVSGTFNRNAFARQAKMLDGTGMVSALILCDIDGLKLINDTLGHSAGDHLIRTIADILNKTCSSLGQVYRMGGDEFLLLLTAEQAAFEMSTIVSSIRQAVSKYNECHSTIPLSVSIGWAISDDGCETLSNLMKVADKHMYQEKVARREKVRQGITQALLNRYD